MKDVRWLTRDIVLALHGALLAEHGGEVGLRDEGALESALSRPRQKRHYRKDDVIALAAAYAFALSSNHPFLDGNKRVALASLDVFLRLNGWKLVATEVDAAATILALAAGKLTEAQLEAWTRDVTEPL